MQSRNILVILAVAVCATLAPGTNTLAVGRLGTDLPSTLDVAVEVVRPETIEAPGLVPVTVRLTNAGDTSALVESLRVTISVGYGSFVTGVPLTPSQTRLVFMPTPWVCPPGGEETCTAWITYADDMNHHNDTDVVIVNSVSGLSEGARTDVSRSPGWLSGSLVRTTCFVSHTEPLNVTLFDIKGRAVLASRLGAALAGMSALNLRGLRSGVYLVRLDDGRAAVTRKLVVQH
jgi:hypothetical protein